jgi:hypothetical protein
MDKNIVKYFQDSFKNHTFVSVGNVPVVMVGETADFLALCDKHRAGDIQFPRIETLVWKGNGSGYSGNMSRDGNLILQVAGYTYRDYSDLTEDDYYELVDWIEEIEDLVFKSNLDRKEGILEDGFMQVHPFQSFDVETELFGNVGAVLINFGIQISKSAL